jgi:hypothetical protein
MVLPMYSSTTPIIQTVRISYQVDNVITLLFTFFVQRAGHDLHPNIEI